MARRKTESVRVSRGIRNVLADLRIADAGELTIKVRLAVAINRQLAKRELARVDAAALLGINQPKISALRHFKIDGFSVERLMSFLSALSRRTSVIGD